MCHAQLSCYWSILGKQMKQYVVFLYCMKKRTGNNLGPITSNPRLRCKVVRGEIGIYVALNKTTVFCQNIILYMGQKIEIFL